MRDEENQSIKLLSLIAISGDFPADELNSFGSLEYNKKLIMSLKQEKLIRVFYKDNVRSYRLTSKAKKRLLLENSDRFKAYFEKTTEANLYPSAINRRLRLHRISQALVFMKNSNVKIFHDEKTPLFESSVGTVYTGFYSNNPETSERIKLPAFYTSREIKEHSKEKYKINNSRFIGLLITESMQYIIYNTDDTLMKWESRSEEKVFAVINHFLRQTLTGYVNNSLKTIMIGRNMEIALQILKSTGGYKHGYLMLDGTFYNLLFLPRNEDGIMILKILCSRDIENQTRSILMYNLETPPTSTIVDCDGIDNDGNPVLFAYDFDLERIARFNAGLSGRSKKGSITCFDFQKETLEKYCNLEFITVNTISKDKYKRRFFSG